MMSLIWSGAARRDRRMQLDWYAEFSVEAAERMAHKIIAQARLLAQFPYMGHIGTTAGTYHLVIPGTPFLFVYRIDEAVTILRLLHGSQDWPGRF